MHVATTSVDNEEIKYTYSAQLTSWKVISTEIQQVAYDYCVYSKKKFKLYKIQFGWNISIRCSI